MRKRAFGKAGFEVSEMALGTWGLSGDGYGPVHPLEVERTIDRALTLGIDLFETADVYGCGEMEKVLGARLPQTARIVTKIGTNVNITPPRKTFRKEYLKEALSRSLERMKRSKIDVLLLHNPTMLAMSSEELFAWLKEQKANNIIGVWGVSAGERDVARAAITHGAEVVEMAYNIFFADDLHDIGADLSEASTAVLVHSVLAYGLLAGHWSADKEFEPGDHRRERWNRRELRTRIGQLDAVRGLVNAMVPTMRSAALRFVLSNALVSSAVIGPRTVTQLEQLVRESGSPPYLSDKALSDLAIRLQDIGIQQMNV